MQTDDPGRAPVLALLEAHLAFTRASSPACSRHAIDLDGLRTSDITFWSATTGDRVVGCGALREIDAAHGEIKSMHTAQDLRRSGVARRMLDQVIAEAQRRGYRRLSLETGSQPAFEPARRLYAARGFAECGPFAGYREDPNSTFMKMTLD